MPRLWSEIEVEVEADERAHRADDRSRIRDEVLEAHGGEAAARLRTVGEREPVRVLPVLGCEPELLLVRRGASPRRRLSADRAVTGRVGVAKDEQEQRLAAFEQRVDVPDLDRVRMRLVEKASSPGLARVDEQVLSDEALELDRVLVARVGAHAPVRRQELVARVDRSVRRAEHGMLEICAMAGAPERRRQARHPVADEAQLVGRDPVPRVAAHARDVAVPEEAARDQRRSSALQAEHEDRPVDRNPVDRG